MQQGPVSSVARGQVPSPRLVRIKMIKKRKIMALAVFGITAISIALICIVLGILENRIYSSLIMGVILLPLGIFSCLGCLKICCVDKGMKRIPLSSSPPESVNDPPSNPLEQEQPSGTSFQTISLDSSSSHPTATTHSRSSNEPTIGWSVPVPTSSLSEKPGAYSPQDSGTGNSYNPQTGASFNPHNPNIIVMANPYNPQNSPQTGGSSPYNPNITGGSNPYTSQFGGAFNPHNPNIIITSNPHNAQMGKTSSHHNSNFTGASNSYNPIVRPISSSDSKEMEAAEAGPSSPQPRNKDDVSLPTYSDLFGK